MSTKFVPGNWSPFPLIIPWETMKVARRQEEAAVCITFAIVDHHLVQTGRKDGPTDYFLQILAAIKFRIERT